MVSPLISIITVVYNTQSTLEATIRSVLSQQGSLFEYWIIDGGSTDGSISIIQKYEDQLAGWISEPDEGIYDAMNKGIDRATGKWIYFLGSDDSLEPDTLARLVPYLCNDKMLVYGDVYFNNSWRYPSSLSLRTFLQNTVHHQGAFYNKKLFEKFRYDTHLRILSDYELNLYIHYYKFSTQKVPFAIARCFQGGASSQIPLSISETNVVRSRFVKNKVINKFLSIVLKSYYLQKRVRSTLSDYVK